MPLSGPELAAKLLAHAEAAQKLRESVPAPPPPNPATPGPANPPPPAIGGESTSGG